MYSSILPAGPESVSWRLDLVAVLIFTLYLAAAVTSDSVARHAAWFPDRPMQTAYEWQYTPCDGCQPLEPRRDWLKMQQLAGLEGVRFLAAPNEQRGDAYSFAPDTVVLSPRALRLPRCQLSFIVGHELVHLAMRDPDEDARTASVLSGLRPTWTQNGQRALSLLDGDYGLAIKMSSIWQQQERRADWVGALLAADGAGCTLAESAMPYLDQAGYGGGIGAAHQADAARIRFLRGFASPAQRLASR